MCGIHTLHAQTPTQTAIYFNGPTVSDVTPTSAIFSLSSQVIQGLISGNPSDIQNVYFEYYKTEQVCPAIYPIPEYCLPKKTVKGLTSVQVKDLQANTKYTVLYKKDNTIACIKAPCPSNDFSSLSVQFITPVDGQVVASPEVPKYFTKNFGYKARGIDVTKLQSLLIERGFMTGTPTGYFGVNTLKAVKELQRSLHISPTGYFGSLTRLALEKGTLVVSPIQAEYFEGTITAFSTGCFADGECSITVDGKKIITTIGWSQQTVGSIYGSVTSIGDIGNKIGSHAKVYAQKTSDGYTLYGASNYYIEVQ